MKELLNGNVSNGEMISVIYLAALVIFFLILVILTITWIVNKGRSDEEDDVYDEYEDEETYESNQDGSYETGELSKEQPDDIFEEAKQQADFADDIAANIAEYSRANAEMTEEDMSDSAFSDSAFSDSAFSDSTNDFDDSAFHENKTDSAFAEDSAFLDSAFAKDDDFVNTLDDQPASLDDSFVNTLEETTENETASNDSVANEDDLMAEGDTADEDWKELSQNTDKLPELTEAQIAEAEAQAERNEQLQDNVQMGDNGEDSAFPVSNTKVENVAMNQPVKKNHQVVLSTDDFYWFNKQEVASKPAYKTEEMYYQHFNIAKECIEDMLVEMYDCAFVRTEEIRYLAFGIQPRNVSFNDLCTLSTEGVIRKYKTKDPGASDLAAVYEKWCSYVDAFLEAIEVHADQYTYDQICKNLYEFGKSDVEILIQGL